MEAFALGDWGSMHRLQGGGKAHGRVCFTGGLPFGEVLAGCWGGLGRVLEGSWASSFHL